jgi:hypothetical protein
MEPVVLCHVTRGGRSLRKSCAFNKHDYYHSRGIGTGIKRETPEFDGPKENLTKIPLAPAIITKQGTSKRLNSYTI